MKFKIYGWHSIYKVEDEYFTMNIDFLPTIELSTSHHNFPPDENCPIRRKGTNVCFLIGWLIGGITFDFRFGRDTGYWPGHEEE